jgi:hypothetical protein
MDNLNEYEQYCNSDSYTEVQLRKEESKIEEGYPLLPQDIYQICTGALEVAKAEGLYYPHIILQPKYDPYDNDCIGISVVPCGFRPKTEDELKADALENEIDAFADNLGISFYEAKSIYDNLGKIKEYLND